MQAQKSMALLPASSIFQVSSMGVDAICKVFFLLVCVPTPATHSPARKVQRPSEHSPALFLCSSTLAWLEECTFLKASVDSIVAGRVYFYRRVRRRKALMLARSDVRGREIN
jgi:hypothetical protein